MKKARLIKVDEKKGMKRSFYITHLEIEGKSETAVSLDPIDERLIGREVLVHLERNEKGTLMVRRIATEEEKVFPVLNDKDFSIAALSLVKSLIEASEKKPKLKEVLEWYKEAFREIKGFHQKGS